MYTPTVQLTDLRIVLVLAPLSPVVWQRSVERDHLRDVLFESVVLVHGFPLGYVGRAHQTLVQGHTCTEVSVGVVR